MDHLIAGSQLRREGKVKPAPVRSSYEDVQVELTQLIFARLMPTVLLGTLGMTGTVVLVALRYHDPWLWYSIGIMLVPCVARILVVAAFGDRFGGSNADKLTPRLAHRCELLYGIVTLLYYFCLACYTMWCFHYHDIVSWFVASMGTLCFLNALSARLGMRPWIIETIGASLLGALGASLLLSPEPILRWMFILIVLYGYIFRESVRTKFQILVEQLRSRRKLRELAERDMLTGLANSRHFHDRLDASCRKADHFAVLFMDLDRFKAVNDTFGHGVGDTLLQMVADRLLSEMRATDVVGRLGGDEFVMLLIPLLSEVDASGLAQRINRLMSVPFEIEGNEIRIGSSIGIRFSRDTAPNANQIVQSADAALYRAKLAGGGSFRFAE